MAEKQKKQPAKRNEFVDVLLERKRLQLFSSRRVRSTEDAANRFHQRLDQEKFVVLCLSTKNEPIAM